MLVDSACSEIEYVAKSPMIVSKPVQSLEVIVLMCSLPARGVLLEIVTYHVLSK